MCPEHEENSLKRCREATPELQNKRRKDVLQLPTISTISEGTASELVYSGRKLPSNVFANYLKEVPAKRFNSAEDFLPSITCDSLSVAFKVKDVDLQVVCKNEVVDVLQLTGTSSKSEGFCPKFVYSRRKSQSNSTCEKSLKCEDFLLRITSDSPFAAFKEKQVVLRGVCKSKVVGVPQLSSITTKSRISIPQCIYSERELISDIVAKYLTEAPQETKRSLEVISSDAPPVAVMEEEADLQMICKEKVVGVPQSSTINTAFENSLPNSVYSRKKRQSNLMVATAKTDKHVEDFLSASSSVSPSLALKEKEVVLQPTCKNVVGVAQLSTISTISVPKSVYCRAKLWNKSLVTSSTDTPAKTKKNVEDVLLEISSDAQSVVFREKEEFYLAVSKNEVVEFPQPSTVGTMSESSLPKFVYTRRKLWSNTVANHLIDPLEKAKKSVKDDHAVLCSDGPSIALKEKAIVQEAVCTNEVVGVPQISIFSTSSKNSLPKFVYSRTKRKRDSWPNLSTEPSGKKMKSMWKFHSLINSDVQAVTYKEEDGVSQVLSTNVVVGVPQPSRISTSSECSLPKFVYSRSKLRKSSVTNGLAEPSGKAMRSVEKSPSVINSDASSVAFKEKDVVLQALGTSEVVGVSQPSTISMTVKTLPKFVYSRKKLGRKTVVNWLTESTGKTMRSLQHCSSSNHVAKEKVGKDQSEREVCISILKCEGVLQSVCNSQNHISSELDDGSSGNISYRSCKICNATDSSLKMLICDACEEAFHLSCCNPRVKRIPDQEWCCRSCLKKKQQDIRETFSTKTPKMAGVMDKHKSGCSHDASPIVLMLRDTEPYSTGVRVGKGFQADVPDWSGPIEDDDTIGEPTELNPSELTSHGTVAQPVYKASCHS